MWSLRIILLKQQLSLIALLSYFLIDLERNPYVRIKNADALPILLRNNTISSPIIYISDANTKSLVLLTEIKENNSINENLYVFSVESIVDTISHYQF